MLRVIASGGTIILRHHGGNDRNPHAFAQQLIQADVSVEQTTIGRQKLQQSRFLNIRHNTMVAAGRNLSSSITAQIN
tara:strand:+ start:104 stop:334 length:231 start_codon:yes stop_codon:yes gene_type:complete